MTNNIPIEVIKFANTQKFQDEFKEIFKKMTKKEQQEYLRGVYLLSHVMLTTPKAGGTPQAPAQVPQQPTPQRIQIKPKKPKRITIGEARRRRSKEEIVRRRRQEKEEGWENERKKPEDAPKETQRRRTITKFTPTLLKRGAKVDTRLSNEYLSLISSQDIPQGKELNGLIIFRFPKETSARKYFTWGEEGKKAERFYPKGFSLIAFDLNQIIKDGKQDMLTKLIDSRPELRKALDPNNKEHVLYGNKDDEDLRAVIHNILGAEYTSEKADEIIHEEVVMPNTPPASESVGLPALEGAGPPPPLEGDRGETHPPRRQDAGIFEEGSPVAAEYGS